MVDRPEISSSIPFPIPRLRYESPLTERYGTDRMHAIWDDKTRLLVVRDVWIAQAGVQMGVNLVTSAEYEDLVAHREDIDVEDIKRRELDRNHPKYSGHDGIAHISQYAEVAPLGARVIHQGDTTEDTLSNAEIILMRRSVDVIEDELVEVLRGFGAKIQQHRKLVCMGYTHDQAAEPTVFGYRLAGYAQDFLTDLRYIRGLREDLKGKGIKGAVGASASFEQLLEGTGMSAREHERLVMESLGIEPVLITGQTYPRKTTLLTVMTLAGIGMSAHKFARDMKELQSSPFGEVSEPRQENDKSSSAMMHKRNPRHCENIKALSRSLPGKVVEAWMGAAEVTLERGLEDSAGKRSYLPESFILIDEVLERTRRVVSGFKVRPKGIRRNLERFGPFTALEKVLTELSKKGAHRQQMDDILREHVAVSLDAVEDGENNPLRGLIAADERVSKYLSADEVAGLFDSIYDHTGDATQRCDEFLETKLYPAIGGK